MQLTVEVAVFEHCMLISADDLGGVCFCTWFTNATKLDHSCTLGTAESFAKLGSSDYGTASGRLP